MTTSSQVSIHNLNQLIRNAGHPEIEHYDALMKALFGNQITAIKVFNRLIRWLPYSVRPDGAVYKSARELAEETASSEVSVSRTRRIIESVGFDVFLKKANGAPTNHYKLNISRFLSHLAQIFGASVAQIRAWIFGESGPAPEKQTESHQSDGMETPQSDGMETPQSDEMNSVKVIESITIQEKQKVTTPEETTETTVVVADPFIIEEIRSTLNVNTSLIQSWVYTYGIGRVQEVIKAGQAEKQAGNIRKSLVGWVRSALQNGYTWETNTKPSDDPNTKYSSGEWAAFIES